MQRLRCLLQSWEGHISLGTSSDSRAYPLNWHRHHTRIREAGSRDVLELLSARANHQSCETGARTPLPQLRVDSHSSIN